MHVFCIVLSIISILCFSIHVIFSYSAFSLQECSIQISQISQSSVIALKKRRIKTVRRDNSAQDFDTSSTSKNHSTAVKPDENRRVLGPVVRCIDVDWNRTWCKHYRYTCRIQEAFEKRWAHSPQRAAARRITIHQVSLMSRRTPPA